MNEQTATTVTTPKKGTWGLWLVGALALAVLALLFIYAERSLREAPAAADGRQEASAESALLSVEDQQAGGRVVVGMVDVPVPGVWAVIHELRDGELGNALGAARVPAPASDVSVELLRSTEAGMEYAVVLYRNDGQPSFALPGASVYVDFDSGERVETRFSTLP